MIRVVTKYGVYEVSFDPKTAVTCREAVRIKKTESRADLDISPTEEENRVLRLLIYDLQAGHAKFEDLAKKKPKKEKGDTRCQSVDDLGFRCLKKAGHKEDLHKGADGSWVSKVVKAKSKKQKEEEDLEVRRRADLKAEVYDRLSTSPDDLVWAALKAEHRKTEKQQDVEEAIIGILQDRGLVGF